HGLRDRLVRRSWDRPSPRRARPDSPAAAALSRHAGSLVRPTSLILPAFPAVHARAPALAGAIAAFGGRFGRGQSPPPSDLREVRHDLRAKPVDRRAGLRLRHAAEHEPADEVSAAARGDLTLDLLSHL